MDFASEGRGPVGRCSIWFQQLPYGKKSRFSKFQLAEASKRHVGTREDAQYSRQAHPEISSYSYYSKFQFGGNDSLET